MKILHTSDWHIGCSLYGRKRYEEAEAFLNWLAELIDCEGIEALLIAGDVFDNGTPSNRAQEIYYRFLCQVAHSACRHVVITAGNHDSPSFLNAPRELLRFLNVHVIACRSEIPGDEVLVLTDDKGEAELLVCAVPYLRDRDLRKAEAGESLEDKERKLIAGIAQHYQEVCSEAQRIRQQVGRPLPIVAMGHLFTAGGKTVEGDGVRELYVGSLAHVGVQIFPQCIDYLALGHLHSAQKVGQTETWRYCGSPLPLGFGESKQEKSVCQVIFSNGIPAVTTIPVPRFQSLERISGNWQEIALGLDNLKSSQSNAWLEIMYEGPEIITDLRERLDHEVAETGLEILRVKNNRLPERLINSMYSEETLDDLDVNEVFRRCLEANEVPESQHEDLLATYSEVLNSLYEDDYRAD